MANRGKRRKNKNSKNHIGRGILLDNSDTEGLHKERKNNKPSVVILTKDQATLIKSNILIYLERSIPGTGSVDEEKPSAVVDKICQGIYVVFITTDARLMIVASIGGATGCLNLMYICGEDFKAYYKDMMEIIQKFCNYSGIKIINCHARLGIAKKLEELGFEERVYKKKHRNMVKVIEG
jgi:hypothetical protein